MSFYTDVIQKSSFYHSTNVCNDVSMLEPGTRAAVARLISAAHEAGHELRVGETYRSQARQMYLFERHATQLRAVGCHGFGVACDVQLIVNGKYDPDGGHYAFMADICRKLGLIPGSNWGTPLLGHTFRDWDHVQRVPVFRQPALFSGAWYPPVNYDPWQDELDHHIAGVK